MQAITGLAKKESLFDIVKGTAATLAIYSMLMFVGPLAAIFAPFPVLYYTLKAGRAAGIIIIVSAALIFYFINPADALMFFLQCGLFSFLLAWFLAAGNGVARTIAWTTGLELLFMVICAVAYALFSGIDPNALILKEISNFVSQAGAYYQKNGVDGADQEMFRQALKTAADFMSKAYPALVTVTFGAIGCANVQFLKKVAHLLPRRLNLGEFNRYKNPDMMIWFSIVAGFALLIKNDTVTRTALNILVVTISLYFVQGLAIIINFFDRFRVPRFLRFLFYFLLVVQPYLLVAVAAFGLFDLWCDFRAPKKQENL